jgi:DNA-directed RNA polymerase specialized sigma24 family protein
MRQSLHDFRNTFPGIPRSADAAARTCIGAGKDRVIEAMVTDVVIMLWQMHCAGKLSGDPEALAYSYAWRRAAAYVRLQNTPRGSAPAKPEALSRLPGERALTLNAESMKKFLAAHKLLDSFHAAASTELDCDERRLFDALYESRLSSVEAAHELGLGSELLHSRWSNMMHKLLLAVAADARKDPACFELLGTILCAEDNS